MLGAADAAAAFAAIDFPFRDVDNYGPPLPGVLVEGCHQKAGYNGDQSGSLLVSLFDEIKTEYRRNGDTPVDWRNDQIAWMNRCGRIRSEMKSLSRTALPSFGGVRFDAIKWIDDVYPDHAERELAEDGPAVWFRFTSFRVEWVT